MMAALALTFAACSNDDNDILSPVETQPAETVGIPFSATISVGGNSSLRALTESGTTIEATWAVGEKVALIHNGVNDVMEVKSVSGGVATITGTITGSPSDGDGVTVIYPSDAAYGATGDVKADWLVAQDGTLTGTGGTSISEQYDVRKGTGTLKVSGTASLNGSVSLTNQNAIFKLTLKDIDGSNDVSATSVKIYDQTNTLLTTVIPASGYEKAMYVALPITATTLKFAVSDGTTNYFNMASGLSLASKYYQSTIKLATVGDVIMSSGKCAKAGTSGAVAMIAYLGNASDCTNGLAIQLLNSDPESKTWSEAKAYAEGLTAVPGGTWRLPSKDDWQNMFLGCAKSGDASASDLMKPIAGFKEKIAATGISTGISGPSHVYWSSTAGVLEAWCVHVDLEGTYAVAEFSKDDMPNDEHVLGCLAF